MNKQFGGSQRERGRDRKNEAFWVEGVVTITQKREKTTTT